MEDFRHEQDMRIADLDYFEDLLCGVEGHRAELDAGLAPFLDRDVAQVDPIERAVLRLSAYELKYRLDVPYRVVLDQAVEATRRFGSEQGHTYVNGVLDKLARSWRSGEYGAATR
jgi:N utilization substance protein B